MKAYEFATTLTAEGQIEVPPALRSVFQKAQPLRVIILLTETEAPSESSESKVWNQLTTEQFLAGYCDTDAIYDQR